MTMIMKCISRMVEFSDYLLNIVHLLLRVPDLNGLRGIGPKARLLCSAKIYTSKLLVDITK